MFKIITRLALVILAALYLIGLVSFVLIAPWQTIVLYIVSSVVAFLMGRYWRPIRWTSEANVTGNGNTVTQRTTERNA